MCYNSPITIGDDFNTTNHKINMTPQNTIKPKRIKHDYIDNQSFFRAMEDFYHITQKAIADGVPDNELPIASNYVAQCILDICKHMSYRPNFSQYTYLDDMVGDAIEDCFLRMRNFTPVNAKKNAFGYFSTIAWNAMLRRIAKEKKQHYIGYKSTMNGRTNASLAVYQDHDEMSKHLDIGPKDIDMMSRFIDDYETGVSKKKVKAVKVEKDYAALWDLGKRGDFK